MPPKNQEIVLICPKCHTKGFLRRKHSDFHLPQKNMVNDFYEWLEYTSKLYFTKFIDLLFIEHRKIDDIRIPLNQYNGSFMFFKFPLKKIKEFEIAAIKSVIRKTKEKQFDIVYSKDLLKYSHLKNILSKNGSQIKNNKNQHQNKVIFISRIKLFGLFSAIAYETLKKFCEFHQRGIEKDYEKEMVKGLKSISYPMSINIDNRNKWNHPHSVNLSKDDYKLDIKFDIPEKSNYRNRCRVCKITYSKNHKRSWCDKCGNKIFLVKEKHSREYVKNKTKEIKENVPKMNEFLIKFTRFMIIAKNDWFSDNKMHHDFIRLFDNTCVEILENLKMKGKTYFIIVHYNKNKVSKDDEHYISKESDFINISIKLKEYALLMRSLVKTEIYDIGKNNKKIYYKIIQLLRQINFPEKYILLKLYHDFNIFKKEFDEEQNSRIFYECKKILNNIYKNAQRNVYSDPAKLQWDIESLPEKCINIIIKKKLIPSDEIDKYTFIINQYKIVNQDISKEILFKTFPIAGFIESMNKDILSPYKLDLL
jgi:hypothetical protein